VRLTTSLKPRLHDQIPDTTSVAHLCFVILTWESYTVLTTMILLLNHQRVEQQQPPSLGSGADGSRDGPCG
jgi:hypothetical protein